MYHEALEENNNLKSEYEAKLMTANDNLTTATEENEALEEKVDILFKVKLKQKTLTKGWIKIMMKYHRNR